PRSKITAAKGGSLPVECSYRMADLNREETKPAKAFIRYFLAFFAPSRFISHSVLENCTEEGDHLHP
ncbi:MAG: hypothetical protein KKC71_02570, partial [Chloroflexi bacterium]|nr:hypothetical protein [Chloroflexota bacterium]